MFCTMIKKDIFRWIAPIYGLFYNMQRRHYAADFELVRKRLGFAGYRSVVDIGCGTGALCCVFGQNGFETTGVEPVKQMLNIARNKNGYTRFIQADVLRGLPFDDKRFDISIASYVAHGLNTHERTHMYAEMNRITRHLVILVDYNSNRSLLTNVIEWMEHSDYFSFIKKVKAELNAYFGDVRTIDVGKRGSWYVCTPKSK